ncbi:MAG: PAS domain S-box protein [Nibricoccus sp.]
MTGDAPVLQADLYAIGKLLPGVFAVFTLPELRPVYLNPAGLNRLDPGGAVDFSKLTIADFIGVHDYDRFQREIYLQLHVRGFWKGTISLRDMLGSEFPVRVQFLEGPSVAGEGTRHVYLYAGITQAMEEGGDNAVTDEDMLHALLETTQNSIYFKDVASRFLRVSRAQATKFGLPDPRDCIGKTDFDYFTVEHAAPAFQDEQRVIRTGQPVIDLEEKETFSDGSMVWVSTTKLPFYNRAGKLVGTYGISRDITVQKIAQERLRMLSCAVEQSLSSIIITDTQGRIEYVNPYFEKVTGYAANEVIGKNPRILKSGTQSDEFYREMWSTLSAGREWLGDLQNRRKNGELFWERATMSGIRNEQGIITHYVAVKEDITERKKAEEAQRESEALLKAIFSGASDAILLLCDNKLIDCNPKALEMFGYSKDELMKLQPKDVSPSEQPDGRDSAVTAADYIQQALQNGSCQFEWMHQRKDGSCFPAEVLLSSFAFRGRSIIHGSVRDVSEKKKAEVERRELEARLQLTNKLESVGSLAAGVAHEINTPTQFISDNARFLTGAFAQLEKILASHRQLVEQAAAHADFGPVLAEIKATETENELEYLIEEIPRCLEQSLDGLRRIGKIVGSLKEFSHPGGEEKSHANINRAIETTVGVSRHEWKYVADVVTELDPNLPKVNCVIDEINQAVLNLIINATHAIEEANKKTGATRGLITIRTRQDAGNVIIEVTDTGTGIPEAVRERVFEPFFTTKPVGKGTGQGLAIVQAVIVKKHRGNVSFTTEMGKGTTFILTLPLTPPPPGSTRQNWMGTK